jgi:RND family efflux transporter MFP subunit
VAKVEVRDVPVEVRAPVDLRPLTQADVGSKTLGYLDAVFVDRGDAVKKGQAVALVRPSDLPDQLAAAKSALAQAEAAAALAKANLERAARLAPQGIVSQQELQQATTATATTEANLAAAKAQVAGLAVRLGETRIDSPLDGVVVQRRLDPGALVGPTANTGSILTVARIDVIRVFIPVNEREVQSIRVGQEGHVVLDAMPGKDHRGQVVRVTPAIDPLTRTVDAEIQIANPSMELKPGMYGRGSIVVGIHRNGLVVPAGAVQISTDRHFVFVLNGDRVNRVEVQIGVDGGDWLEVTSGLNPQAEIVTAGSDTLSDNALVRAVRNINPYTGTAAGESSIPSRN